MTEMITCISSVNVKTLITCKMRFSVSERSSYRYLDGSLCLTFSFFLTLPMPIRLIKVWGWAKMVNL